MSAERIIKRKTRTLRANTVSFEGVKMPAYGIINGFFKNATCSSVVVSNRSAIKH
jgi:hypothetical protein